MNLVDKLLSADAQKITERETKQIEIKRLSRKMGEPFYITVGAIPGDTFTEITSSALGKKGDINYTKAYNSNALVVIEGVVEPSLKDKALQQHFGASTPKDLAIKLFGGEISKVSAEIAALSGFGNEEEEDAEIKN